MHTSSLREVYLNKIIRRQQTRTHQLKSRINLIKNWRIGVALSGIGIVALLYVNHFNTLGNILFFIVLFGFSGLVYFHNKLHNRLLLHQNWAALKYVQLARIKHNWDELEYKYPLDLSPRHPFAADIDLFGKNSLFHLIDTTTTHGGYNKLVSLLTNFPVNKDTIRQRQSIIKQLSCRTVLRDRLILESKVIKNEKLDGELLLKNLQRSNVPETIKQMLVLLIGFASINIALFVYEIFFDGARYWHYTLSLYVLIQLIYSKHITSVFNYAIQIQQILDRFKNLLSVIERRSEINAPELKDLCAPFFSRNETPSATIARIARICNWLSIRANPLLHIGVNLILPYDVLFGYLYKNARTIALDSIPEWWNVIYELEAYSSLASFSYLNPNYCFPKLEHSGSAPYLAAIKMGHPLIPMQKRIENDFSLQEKGSTILLTGSNMSGKSTFLRSVGINMCLAMSGAPVCATHFSTSLFRIYCSIHIVDDLEAGLSFFYAEVKRLKAIQTAIDSKSEIPVLYLIDEILKGTNNRERFIGSQSYMQMLVQGNGLGIVTSHDLELAELENRYPQIRNYHFRDAIAEQKLTFDYKLKNGPCKTTNALKILALEGLPVPQEQL